MTLRQVLVEMSVMEQRYRTVQDVLAGSTVTDVAERFGVSRQAVHRWLAWYADEGLEGLSDRSSRPHTSPSQIPSEVEALICELRRNHPRWGARRLVFELGRRDCPGPVPSRITVHRVLIRHGLVTPTPRRRRREDYKRWERSRPMELWQLDIVGGIRLADGGEARSSPALTTTPGSASLRPWSAEQPAGPCVWPSPKPCNGSGCPRRS